MREENDDGTPVADYYLMRHFDENGDVLGTVGVDAVAGKYVKEADSRMRYDDTYTPVDPTDASEIAMVQNSILTMFGYIYMDGHPLVFRFMTWMEMKVLLI